MLSDVTRLMYSDMHGQVTRPMLSDVTWLMYSDMHGQVTRPMHNDVTRQEQRDNFLLQGKHFALPLISVSAPPSLHRSST